MFRQFYGLALIGTLIIAGFTVVLPVRGVVNISKSSLSDEGNIIEMIEQVNESMISYYLEGLVACGTRYAGTENCTKAGDYIYNAFHEMGLEVAFDDWEFGGFTSRNVIATIHGIDPSSTAIFIMCAHYDTIKVSPGADDDGSGVAALLAAAYIMRQFSFNHTIRFIAFSGEEVGAYGSYTYARKAYEQGDNIVTVLNLDMVGYANTDEGGQILCVFHVERSSWVADFFATVSTKYMNFINLTTELLPNYPGNDGQSFVYYGYDSIWFAHYDDYPWGHSSQDTLDHINYTYLVKATKLTLAAIAEFTLKPIAVQVILQQPSAGYCYFFNHKIIPSPFGKKWYSGLRGVTIICGRANAIANVISKEAIKYVIFCIDGDFISWDSTPPYEWKIQGREHPVLGRHTLKVYAYTTTGEMASDEMDIIMFSLSYVYGKW